MISISMDFNVEQLEGWLLKKKSGKGLLSFSGSNKRYFKIKAVKGSHTQELALVYSNSPKDIDEPSGWMYLRDVTSILEDDQNDRSWTLVTAVKTMHLEAETNAQYRLWLQGFVNLCVNADVSKVKSIVRKADPKARGAEQKFEKITDDRPIDGRTNTVVTAAPKPSSRRPSADAADSKTLSNTGNTDSNSVGSGSGSSTGSGGNAAGAAARPSVPKEDHRKQNYSAGKTDANTTSRLHRYIRGEPDTGDSKEASSAGETEVSAAAAAVPATVVEDVAPKRVVSSNNTQRDESEIQEISVSTQPKKRPTRFYRRDESHYSSDEEDYETTGGKARGLSVSTAADEKESSDTGKGDVKGESNISPSESVAIRKYKDTMEGSEASSRTTVDDIIKGARNAPRPLSREIESDDDDVDLSKEKNNYASSGSGKGSEKGKPPLPSGKNPISQSVVNSVRSNTGAESKPLTPPRNSRAPVPASRVTVDSDFGNWDDWDASQSDDSPVKPRRGPSGPSASSMASGVKPDENWLDEDFDD